MVFFAQVHQPLGVLLALFAVGGFFWSLSGHRISHDCRWPNPALFGALFSGIVLTAVCYFAAVLPRIWPGNVVSFTIAMMNSTVVLYILWRFTRTDPGFDRVGKISSDGSPMTILDIAKQGDQAFEGPVTYSFCTTCEIVIPERTKHCKLCEACCTGFDHHCVWLYRCVAYNNHRLFILFCLSLALDHFIFIKEALSCISTVADSISPIPMAHVGFEEEQWVLFVMLCNLFSGMFVSLNAGHQLINVSRRETTYFDASGQAAYQKKRQRQRLNLMKRFRILKMFFTNYSKWYRLNDLTGTHTAAGAGKRRKRTKQTHVV
jgi:palmitoyltransferase